MRRRRVRRRVYHVDLRRRRQAPLRGFTPIRPARPRHRRRVQHGDVQRQARVRGAAPAAAHRGSRRSQDHEGGVRSQPHNRRRRPRQVPHVGIRRVRPTRSQGPEGRVDAEDGRDPGWRQELVPAGLRRGRGADHELGDGAPGPDVLLRPAQDHRRQHHVPGAVPRPAGVEASERGVRRHHLRGVRRGSGHHLGARGGMRRAGLRPQGSQELGQPKAGGVPGRQARHPGRVRRRPHALPHQAVRRGWPAGVGAPADAPPAAAPGGKKRTSAAPKKGAPATKKGKK